MVVQGGECYGYQYDVSDGFGGQGTNGSDLQSAGNDDLYGIQYFRKCVCKSKGNALRRNHSGGANGFPGENACGCGSAAHRIYAGL